MAYFLSVKNILKKDLEQLCAEMVQADMELFRRDELLKREGFDVKNEYE